jgi:hypothetical protein
MANRTAEILTRVQTIMRSRTDQYAPAYEMQSNFRIASDQLLNSLIGPIFQYRDQRPSPIYSSQSTSDIDNLLSSFRTIIEYTLENAEEQIWAPNETPVTSVGRQIFKYEDWQVYGYSIHFPPQNQLNLYLNSRINYPAYEEPYGQDVGNGRIKVWPFPTGEQKITAMVIAGDPDINVEFLPGTQTINPDPAVTTQTLWTQRAYDSLVYLIVGLFGIEIMAPPLIQAIMQQKAQSL